MSSRLQILVPESLEKEVRKAAQRRRLSTSAWVRQSIERTLAESDAADSALERLAQVDAPTGDIATMLADIEAGRKG